MEEILLSPHDLKEIKKKGFVDYGRYIITTKTWWKKKLEEK